MSDGRTSVFIFLIVFWTVTAIFSNYFSIDILTSDIRDLAGHNPQPNEVKEKSLYEKVLGAVFDVADNVPVVNIFTPLIKMMTIGYVPDFPVYVSMVLDIMFLLSVYVVVTIVRGV